MKLNAAQLDRYLTAERTYNAAKERGATEDEAKDAAREAVKAKREQQLLRSLGIEESV